VCYVVYIRGGGSNLKVGLKAERRTVDASRSERGAEGDECGEAMSPPHIERGLGFLIFHLEMAYFVGL